MRMKLGLHLIPKTSFSLNLRNTLNPRQWSRLSRKIRREHNFTCQFCGSKEDRSRRWYTHLHEIWQFDNKTGVQKLVGFECLCPDCHHIHHWSFSEYKGYDLKALLKHACSVNNCSQEEFKRHIHEERRKWLERSQRKWTLDYGEWGHLI